MFDIAILVVAGIAFVRGLMNGFVKELAGMAAILLGVYGAARFSPITESLIAPYVSDAPVRLVAFAVTLVAIVLLVYLISFVLDRFLSLMSLSLPNRIMGGILRAARFLFIISCALGVVNRFMPSGSFLTDEQRAASYTYDFVCSFSNFIFPYIDSWMPSIS